MNISYDHLNTKAIVCRQCQLKIESRLLSYTSAFKPRSSITLTSISSLTGITYMTCKVHKALTSKFSVLPESIVPQHT